MDTPCDYVRNAQGDIVKLIDSSGNTVVEYTYDSWGKLIATTGSLANTVGANQPFRYRGYVYDEETGWYYLQTRYYDPTTCRFISADVLLSTGQGVIGHNSFAYCLNSPIMRIDPWGMEAGAYAVTWAGSMWWLCIVDSILPVGDIIYALGCAVTTVVDVASCVGVENIAVLSDNIAQSAKQAMDNSRDSYQNNSGKNKLNQDDKENKEIKRFKNNNEANKASKANGYKNAEALKDDFVKGAGSKFNMAYSTKTKEILLVPTKGFKSIIIHTELYIK